MSPDQRTEALFISCYKYLVQQRRYQQEKPRNTHEFSVHLLRILQPNYDVIQEQTPEAIKN
jgi:hypothetical protein